MKRLYPILLSLCLLVTLASCTSNDGPTSGAASSGVAESDPINESSSTGSSPSSGGGNAISSGEPDSGSSSSGVSSTSSASGSSGNSNGVNGGAVGSGTTQTPSKPTAPPQSGSTSPKPSEPTVPEPPREPNATAADSKAVAQKVLEYINQLRQEQGVPAATKLPGMTKYAEYRSRQIISNFAHDTDDERAAATALKYGEYIDPPKYGMTGEPYYEAPCGEAIAKAGYVGTVDYVGERLARQVRNSAGHWAYVGAAKYQYIAVGVTYESGTWYCDIAVSHMNADEAR